MGKAKQGPAKKTSSNNDFLANLRACLVSLGDYINEVCEDVFVFVFVSNRQFRIYIFLYLK